MRIFVALYLGFIGDATGTNLMMIGGNVNNTAYSRNIQSLGSCYVDNYDSNQGIRDSAAAVFHHDELYVCGGFIPNITDICTIIVNGTQKAGPSMTIPRAYFSMTKVETDFGDSQVLVVFGGKYTESDVITTSVVEMMDRGAWFNPSYMYPSEGRWYHCAVSNSKHSLVVIGGYDQFSNVLTSTDKIDITGDLTPITPLDDLPAAIAGHACTLDNGGTTIYVSGGVLSDGSFSDAVYTLSDESSTWNTIGAMKYARGFHAMGLVTGEVTVYSGYGPGIGYKETYDEDNNVWTPEAIYTQRFGAASVVFKCG